MENKINMFTICITAMSFLSMSSCTSSKIDTFMVGFWSVDTIIFNNYDIKPCLASNIIEFQESDCTLPISPGFCDQVVAYSEEGKWDIIKSDSNNYFIDFITKNKIFSGHHKLSFRLDEVHRRLIMTISSDSLFVTAKKGFFNYDENKDYIYNLYH